MPTGVVLIFSVAFWNFSSSIFSFSLSYSFSLSLTSSSLFSCFSSSESDDRGVFSFLVSLYKRFLLFHHFKYTVIHFHFLKNQFCHFSMISILFFFSPFSFSSPMLKFSRRIAKNKLSNIICPIIINDIKNARAKNLL